MCGRDRATSIGVEHMNEAVEVIVEERENEVNSSIIQQPRQYFVSTSSVVEPHQRKGVGKIHSLKLLQKLVPLLKSIVHL